MTGIELRAARIAAGQAYAAAAAAYIEAWATLMSYDMVINDPKFGEQPRVAPYPEFFDELEVNRDPSGRAYAKHVLLKTAGD